MVNNVPTPPTQCWTVIRDLLLSAAVEETSTENIKDGSTSPATEAERVRVDKLASEGDPPVTARVVGHPPEVERDGKDTDKNHDECDTGTMTPMAAGISPVKPKAMHSTPKSLPTSCSDDAAPEAENTPSSSADCGSGAAAGETQGGDGGSRDGSCGPGGEGSGCKTKRSGLEIYVDQCAWRVLHAASRTASGGDSFFVVHVRVYMRHLFSRSSVVHYFSCRDPVHVCCVLGRCCTSKYKYCCHDLLSIHFPFHDRP